MEQIDGHPVLYSLGNLIFDLTRSEETVEGVIVEVTFIGARPAQIRLHPTVMVDLVQPEPAPVGGRRCGRDQTDAKSLGGASLCADAERQAELEGLRTPRR